MSSVGRLLKALLLPHRRANYIGKMFHDVATQRPNDFLTACDALGVTAIEKLYLGKYLIMVDVRGRSISEGILRDGHFQYDLFKRTVAENLDRSHLFVNVGANIGTTCLNAIEAGFKELVAFEPVRGNFALLERNMLSVAGEADIALHRHAIGAEEGTAQINLHPSSGGRHSLLRDFGHDTEQVTVRRLDDVLPERHGILWIDTEGFELEVLQGARRYLRDWTSAICVEITPEILGTERLAELVAILEEHFTTFVDGDGKSCASLSAMPALRAGLQVDVLCTGRRSQ